MSLAALEALFGRVTSIFLVPLVIFLSMIAHFISGGIDFSGSKIQGISSHIFDLVSSAAALLRRTCMRFAILERASA
jgi:thiamine transporter ThiT